MCFSLVSPHKLLKPQGFHSLDAAENIPFVSWSCIPRTPPPLFASWAPLPNIYRVSSYLYSWKMSSWLLSSECERHKPAQLL
jgi:hypothetical protein